VFTSANESVDQLNFIAQLLLCRFRHVSGDVVWSVPNRERKGHVEPTRALLALVRCNGVVLQTLTQPAKVGLQNLHLLRWEILALGVGLLETDQDGHSSELGTVVVDPSALEDLFD